jgi:signal transduction histidine kinase/CheY-like chemotaxis protein
MSAPIVVLRPFWQRAWFFALLGVTLATLGVVANRYARRRRHARLEESRRLESELARKQRLEALGVLAGGIAHDFNNLLTVVLGNLSLLRTDRAVAEHYTRNLDSTESAVRRARDLTQQLLTFSRGGAPVRRPAALDEAVRESASLALSGTNVRCAFDLDADLWTTSIDVGQINQVLHNLLINAAQAMPGGGTVRIACRNRFRAPPPLGEGHWIETELADDGCGIEPEHMSRLFDPYFSTKEGGSGLGLAVAYSIVRRHDGLLTADSNAGAGATFRVWLPASRSAVESQDRLERTKPADPAVPAHVLVMDDEQAVREIVGELLTGLGCTVEYAEDGAQAVELWVARQSSPTPFDIALMDLTVPGGMGGKEAMARLLAVEPDACGVVASGYSHDPVMACHADYGFRASLCKPFGKDELSRVLAQVLPRARTLT